MIPPLLKLEITQGPRAGESLEFKPGSTVRIGRYVRGNEITIKDDGISTKHLRIDSDSENWIIHDLGSSNGTIVNSVTIDRDTPVNLSHGDVIKLGAYTSIVVNFVTDVPEQEQEHKLPPRPRRNNKLLAVSDPDPVELVQEKPRSSEQEEHEPPKRTRASRKKAVEDIVDKETELEVENEKNVKRRVGRPRKVVTSAIAKEEEVLEEKNGNSRARRGKNSESVQKLGLNSVKLEVEDTPKGVEISEVKSRKRVTRSGQIENAGNPCFGLENLKVEDTALEQKYEKRTTRSTRSKKTEIGGDSFLELEMVLSQARKGRAKRRKMEQEQEPSKSVVQMEARNDDAGEEALKDCRVEENKENGAQEGCSERSDDKCDNEDESEGDGSKRAEQVENESRKKSSLGEDDLNCTVREDGGTESLQGMGIVEEECRDTVDCNSVGAGTAISDDGCDDEKVEKRDDRAGEAECYEGSKRVDQVNIELSKSTIGEEDVNCILREDVETENLQETEEECPNEERECQVEEAEIATVDDGCDEEKVEQGSSNKNVERVEVDLGKMKIGEWFALMEIQLAKEITEETEKMIEPMRSKSLRVHKHITEQKSKGV